MMSTISLLSLPLPAAAELYVPSPGAVSDGTAPEGGVDAGVAAGDDGAVVKVSLASLAPWAVLSGGSLVPFTGMWTSPPPTLVI